MFISIRVPELREPKVLAAAAIGMRIKRDHLMNFNRLLPRYADGPESTPITALAATISTSAGNQVLPLQ
jgi:hypothetical protein